MCSQKLVHKILLLVPGDGGSQMEAKLNKPSVVHYVCDKTSDWFSLWLNIELLVPVVIDCFVSLIFFVQFDVNFEKLYYNLVFWIYRSTISD